MMNPFEVSVKLHLLWLRLRLLEVVDLLRDLAGNLVRVVHGVLHGVVLNHRVLRLNEGTVG
jgi:hypothetical protein